MQAERLLAVARLALDRELGVLAAHIARDRELQRKIAELAQQSEACSRGPETVAGTQMGLWQEWRWQKRKQWFESRAAIRSDIEEAALAARQAFGRVEAAERIRKKLSE